MLELCYTSVPKGIRPGSSGYTTVAYTKDLPTSLVQRLEGLSTFDHVDKNAAAFAKNPVNHAHLAFGSGQQRLHVVSRIAACEPDHSGRTNYFAHHVIVTEPESRGVSAGPAAMAAGDGLFMGAWQGEPRLLPARPLPTVRDAGSAAGAAWQAAGLDSGWVDYLADRVQQRGKPAYVICPKHVDALALVADVIAAVPPDQRWDVTFATHATAGFPGLGVDCQLRFVVAGTAYAAEVKAKQRGDCIDLTTRPAAPAVAPRPVAAEPSTRNAAGVRTQPQGAGDRYARPAGRSSAAGEPDSARMPPMVAGERRGFVPSEPATGKSIAVWLLAASTLVATVAAAFFAYDGYRWRQIAREQDDEIRKLTSARGRSEGNKSKETSRSESTDETNEGPSTDPETLPSEHEQAATAPPPDSPTPGARKDESSSAKNAGEQHAKKTHVFKISDAKSKVAKIRGDQEAEVTLVSGLGKDDAVTIGIRHGAGVLECEVKEKKNKWEVMERSGGGKALAIFTRERGEGTAGDLLRLKVPKSELLRLVTFVVGVTPVGSGPEIREEFSLADPITNGVDLTPAKKSKDDNLAIRECGGVFQLFTDKAASERFARILAAAAGLELHVQFQGPRHAGAVERDGTRQTLVIKRLQAPDGTPYDAGKYEICGIALDVLGGDLKSKDGSLPLRGWWIQDPTAGAPAEGRGARVPVTWDEDDVLGPAKEKLAKAIEAKREADRIFAEAERKKEGKALEVAGENQNKANAAVKAAEEAVANGRAALEPIRRIQNEMSLKDFQGVAMRMTLRRPGDDDEIVIVDSSK